MTSTAKPALRHLGLRHLALRVRDLERALWFYRDLLGFDVVWRPDRESVYLSSGCDVLALHLADEIASGPSALDHLGVLVESAEEVPEAEAALAEAGVPILQGTKQHRDHSVSCYVSDPDGNRVQILFEPKVSPLLFSERPP